MRMFSEHVTELTRVILNTRELCGNEAEAIRDYFADYGFSKSNIDAPIIASKARLLADEQWNEYRREAGVKP